MPSAPQTLHFRLPPLLHLAGGLFVLMLVIAALLSRAPDLDLHFSRDIPSKISKHDLSAFFDHPDAWPGWFHQTAKAEIYASGTKLADLARAKPISELAAGASVVLSIDPQKGPWRKYQILVHVDSYVPGKTLVLSVSEDSTGRLTRMFTSLSWRVNLRDAQPNSTPEKFGRRKPLPNLTVIEGEVTAHTTHWKARLFGRLAPRILLYNVFFPNTVRLAEIDQPEPTSAFETAPPKAPPQEIAAP